LDFQRWKSFDEKAMHMATSTGTILTLYFGLVSFTLEKILELSFLYILINLWLVVIILFLFSYSIYNAFECIRSHPVNVGDPKKFIKAYSEQNLEYFLNNFPEELEKSIIENSEIIRKKAKRVNCSIRLFWFGIISLVIYVLMIILGIVSGG